MPILYEPITSSVGVPTVSQTVSVGGIRSVTTWSRDSSIPKTVPAKRMCDVSYNGRHYIRHHLRASARPSARSGLGAACHSPLHTRQSSFRRERATPRWVRRSPRSALVWHCVALFPNVACSRDTDCAEFLRKVTACDDVTGLFRRLLICWFSVRFRAGSPISALRSRGGCPPKRRCREGGPHFHPHSQTVGAPLEN